ncbi:Pkinase domain-containing protein [Rhizoctonia solani AG-1 IA]|uniref:Pkinase domain-containing protein n=1 Tax=Thanatephorus cucumeris (strain AG1-IA) TaxID=983506 RepID=L8WWN8_THACA|nr:Pkinase domain-containing protein [Rhizoctonia solani AG-1 IA]
MAMHGHLDLIVGTSMGNSVLQSPTALLQIVSWIIGKGLTLAFAEFETVALFVSVIFFNLLVVNGKSNYMDGIMCCALYVVIAMPGNFGIIRHIGDTESSNTQMTLVFLSRLMRCVIACTYHKASLTLCVDRIILAHQCILSDYGFTVGNGRNIGWRRFLGPKSGIDTTNQVPLDMLADSPAGQMDSGAAQKRVEISTSMLLVSFLAETTEVQGSLGHTERQCILSAKDVPPHVRLATLTDTHDAWRVKKTVIIVSYPHIGSEQKSTRLRDIEMVMFGGYSDNDVDVDCGLPSSSTWHDLSGPLAAPTSSTTAISQVSSFISSAGALATSITRVYRTLGGFVTPNSSSAQPYQTAPLEAHVSSTNVIGQASSALLVKESPMVCDKNIEQTLGDIVTSTMSCRDVVTVLANHGCVDLTELLDESACSDYAITNGGFGDVYSGRLLNENHVAIKIMRALYDPMMPTRIYHKASHIERCFSKQFLTPAIKTASCKGDLRIAEFRGNLAMISNWEENGSLLYYLTRYPSADRCALVRRLLGVDNAAFMTGILSSECIDLPGPYVSANVLIASDGRPMLMDFGNASLQNATLEFTNTNTGPCVSVRWTVRQLNVITWNGRRTHLEVFLCRNRHPRYLMQGNIPLLATFILSEWLVELFTTVVSQSDPHMQTILETFTSQIPFPDKSEQAVLTHVMIYKKTPTRPEKIISGWSVYDHLWAILMKCWSFDPKNRPDAREVWDVFQVKATTPEELQEKPEGY